MDFEEAYKQVRPGSLLIAEPYSQDPYFKRSVVLVAGHSHEEGTLGFIVNKQLSLNLCDLIEEFPSGDFMPCLGGPVRPSTLNYIHNFGETLLPNALPITKNLFWGGDFDLLRTLLSTGEITPGKIKFFLGTAGWESGQLYREFSEGAWGVYCGKGLDIVDSPPDLWYRVVEMTEDYCHWGLIPENPANN